MWETVIEANFGNNHRQSCQIALSVSKANDRIEGKSTVVREAAVAIADVGEGKGGDEGEGEGEDLRAQDEVTN